MQTYPPGTRIGQYEIASRPMMGGMGVVYFALDHGNDERPVALKTFRPELLPDRAARDRFLREGTAWVDLGSHPHIVRCYEVEYIDPTAFISLELITKEQGMNDASLRSWLIPGQALPIGQSLLFALQIARGMQHACAKIPGFVHRDLKPENLLVGADKWADTQVNHLRVTDFGLATIFQGEGEGMEEEEGAEALGRTHLTRGIVGTPLYMAPEQWRGETTGVYTDVYALGCILFEMLCGGRTAQGVSLAQLQEAHCSGKIQPIPKSLPDQVGKLIAKCLALEPAQRYGEWSEVTESIEHTYAKQSGAFAPRAVDAVEASRDERMQAGWSYNAMGLAYLDMGKAQVAADYFEKALSIAHESGDRREEGAALGNLGSAYLNLGDTRRAIRYYEQCLELHREIGDRRGEGNDLGNLGIAYVDLGDARSATEYYEQQMAIAREIGDRRGESNAHGNLGNAYQNLGDARRAIGYYEQALEIDREIGDRRGEGADLGNLGSAYRKLGDARHAVGYFEQVLEIAREIGDRRMEGGALGNLGLAYVDLGDARRAIGYYEESIAIRREIDDLMGLANVSGNMAILYMQRDDPRQALKSAQEAVRVFTQIGHTPNAQRAQQLIDQLQGGTQSNLVQAAFEAFQQAGSLDQMMSALAQHPMLKHNEFIQVIQDIIKEQVPQDLKPAFEQKLSWLKEIIGKKG